MQPLLRLRQLLLQRLLPRPVRLLHRGADSLHPGAGPGLRATCVRLAIPGEQCRAFLQQHCQLLHHMLTLCCIAAQSRQLRLGRGLPASAAAVLVLLLPPAVQEKIFASTLEQSPQSLRPRIMRSRAPAQARHRRLEPLHHHILHLLQILLHDLVHELRPDGPWRGQEAVHDVVGHKITDGVKQFGRHHRIPLRLGGQQGEIPLVLGGELAEHREDPIVCGVRRRPLGDQPEHVVVLLRRQLAQIPLRAGKIQLGPQSSQLFEVPGPQLIELG
mmetsp:Transcript_30478/g.78821  ORF Transcript_30478/g.78821 Transcript_30478/m.78821 type:complete len:273 (-) Transcript_30478:440-1258(-)